MPPPGVGRDGEPDPSGPAATARTGNDTGRAGELDEPHLGVFRLTSVSAFCYKKAMGSSI